MALDWCQNFISTQYLQNELIEFDQIFYNHLILTTSRFGLIHIFYTQYLDKYKIGILLSAYFGDMLYVGVGGGY